MQDWLYDEGDDTTKSVYQSKIDEINYIAAPIIQRHYDKEEEARLAQINAKKQQEEEQRAAEAAAKLREQREKQENMDTSA